MNKCGLDILRGALCLNIQEFAEEIGVTRATVWNWRKNSAMSKIHKRHIHKLYGIPYDIDIQSELTDEQASIVRRCVLTYLIGKTLESGEVFITLPNGFAILYKNDGNEVIFNNEETYVMKKEDGKCFSYIGTQIQK